jgi:putative endonuclease
MKTKTENYNKGKIYEDEAKVFLESKGYNWVESNYENRIGEIDIIMRDNDWLVFVEVKYKTDDYFGLPEEMITPKKLCQVRKVAESYIFLKQPKEKKYRIDAVCILGQEIRHYENLE